MTIPSIETPFPAMCQFCRSIPGNSTTWCFAYAFAEKYMGSHWSEYPPCDCGLCPLLHPNLIQPLRGKKQGKFEYCVDTPWGRIWFQQQVSHYNINEENQ